MKPIRIALQAAAVAFAAATAAAQVGLNKVGQSTLNFQLVSVSPRASGMGEAFCSVGRGAESLFFNPAGIAEPGGRLDAQITLTQWIAGIRYLAGAVIWNAGVLGSVGLSAVSVDYGTLHATSLLSEGESGLYPLGYRDDGEMRNVGAWSVGLAAGRAISRPFSIGGGVRLAGQSLGVSRMPAGAEDNDAVKLVFDAGVKYDTGWKGFRFGMAIRNFSSNLRREEISEPMPVLFTMGAAMDLMAVVDPGHGPDRAFTVAVDFLHPNNYSERVNAGCELRLLGVFALRGGIQTNRDLASWSVGAGLAGRLGSRSAAFDYAYSDMDLFDGVHRFSLGIGI